MAQPATHDRNSTRSQFQETHTTIRSASTAACVALLAGIGSLATPTARASWEATNASGTCQGALPAFAGTLRARPMALGNEGSTSAFVTCSINAGDNGVSSKAIIFLRALVVNSGSASATVNCTLVDGYADGANYIVKSNVLNAGQSVTFDWVPSELPGASAKFGMPNLSCSLPADKAIYWIGYTFTAPTS